MRIQFTLIAITIATVIAATGCGGRLAYNVPPAQQLLEPGPGVGGPGPGVIPPEGGYGMGGAGFGGPVIPAGYEWSSPNGNRCCPGGPGPGACGPGGCDCGPGDCGCGPVGCGCGAGCCGPGCGPGCGPDYGPGCGAPGWFTGPMMYGMGSTSQISFLGDDGIEITWDVGGGGLFDSTPLVTPGRQDFYQASIYRLRLSNIPGRPGVALFPTLEVAPVTPRTDAYLAHAPIPVQFTEEDFDQVLSGNFVTKVIYLPDPEFQELALAGVETLVSTRLDPDVDPIVEADRRGSILAILRIGNKNLQQAEMVDEMGMVVPASYEEGGAPRPMPRPSAGGRPPVANDPNVNPAQYCGPGGGGGGYYGGPGMDNMPMGMPTSGFAPPAVPPQMLAGGGQYGMPITGTPIGLPGPPHIPLGGPAGLQRHVMKNRTRVAIPPPTSQVNISVKQRPGLNYPNPASKVYVDEVHREPARIFGGLFDWLGSGPPPAPAGTEECY